MKLFRIQENEELLDVDESVVSTMVSQIGAIHSVPPVVIFYTGYAETMLKVNKDGSMIINLAPIDDTFIVPDSQTKRYALVKKKKIPHNRVAMGVGQVMGFNHLDFGYASAEDMFKALEYDIRAQFVVQAKFLAKLKVPTSFLMNPTLLLGKYYGAKATSQAGREWIARARTGIALFNK